MIKHIDIIIQGKILDIGFCFQSMIAANQNNVKGRINYTKYGAAHIEAEATQPELNGFIESCKNIPNAIISEIIIEDGKIINYQDFEII